MTYKVSDGVKSMYHTIRDDKIPQFTVAAEIDRCLRTKGLDFCPDCPQYRDCRLSKQLLAIFEDGTDLLEKFQAIKNIN